MNASTPSPLVSALVANLDLDDYEDISSGVLVLVNPATQAPTTATITLASKEHQARKQIDLARTRKLRNAFNVSGKMPVSDPVDDYDDETDYLVASTLDWSLTKSGEPLPFSPASARLLYTNPQKQWVRAQVVAAINKTELFIKSSAKA